MTTARGGLQKRDGILAALCWMHIGTKQQQACSKNISLPWTYEDVCMITLQKKKMKSRKGFTDSSEIPKFSYQSSYVI